MVEPGSKASEPTLPLPESKPELVKTPLTTALLLKVPLLFTSPVNVPVLPRTKVAPGETARGPSKLPVTASVPPCTLVPPV